MAGSVKAHSVFAARLKQARERLGLTQTELGLRAGLEASVASPRVNQYERGVHEPQLATAKRLAKALGIPPAFLYTEDEILARLLLRWGDLSVRQKKDLLKQVEAAPAPRTKRLPLESG